MIKAAWDEAWSILFGVLEGLGPADLRRTITIRSKTHTVVEALERQLAHYASHVGQIVLLAKHLKGAAWDTLSMPRGGSAAFNAKIEER